MSAEKLLSVTTESQAVETNPRAYFPGLDALRFYAAISVVVAHLERNFAEQRTIIAEYPLLRLLFVDAQTAVSLFFVLSGFLITYLLFKEKNRTGTIGVRRFYARRALRIWPLYYMITLICFVLLPPLLGPGYFFSPLPARSAILTILFLANLIGPMGPLGHLWSISLEEQFYLVWPWILKRGDSFFLKVALGVIFLKVILYPVVAGFHSDAMMKLFLASRFECMAIGAVGAYIYVRRTALLRWIYHPAVQVVSWAVLLGCALVDVPLNSYTTLALSTVFLVLILNLATNARPLVQIDHPALNALGKMSYGVYMYHYPLLYVLLFLRQSAGLPENETSNALLYIATIGGTLLLAYASYRWFETPFLNLKKRFEIARLIRPVDPPEIQHSLEHN